MLKTVAKGAFPIQALPIVYGNSFLHFVTTLLKIVAYAKGIGNSCLVNLKQQF